MEAIKQKITRIIPTEKKITIATQDGSIIISRATHVFNCFIAPGFKRFGLDKPSRPTKKTSAVIREMIGSGTFFQIFKDIDPDLGKSALTMSQVIDFCDRNADQLYSKDGFMLFLVERNINFLQRMWQKLIEFIFNRQFINNYFVVDVYMNSLGRYAGVKRLKDNNVWDGEDCRRIICPGLAP